MIRRYINDERGITGVEFALISLTFIAMVMGIFELGRLAMARNAFQYAIEETLRYALIETGASESELKQYIAGQMSNMTIGVDPNTDLSNVTVSWPNGSNNVQFIQLTGTYTFDTLMPFLPDGMDSIDMSATARMAVQGSGT